MGEKIVFLQREDRRWLGKEGPVSLQAKTESSRGYVILCTSIHCIPYVFKREVYAVLSISKISESIFLVPIPGYGVIENSSKARAYCLKA